MISPAQQAPISLSVVGDGDQAAPAGLTQKTVTILREGREATLATLRPDGWPQATIINYVNDDKYIYFDCAVLSQKAYNISKDDWISFALLVPIVIYQPILGLSLAGHAERLESPPDVSRLLELWRARYPWMRERLESDLRDFAFYVIAPSARDAGEAVGHGFG